MIATVSASLEATGLEAKGLEIRGLVVERGGRIVLDDLDLTARAGHALVVTGPNGAGKSTLLRAIAGLVRPLAGSIRLTGTRDTEASVGEQCHYLGHNDALKASLSALENLTFWADYLGGGGLDPLAALGEVDLSHAADLPAGWLSAGQRRRLGLARLLVARRPVWLMDEPTSALDAASEARLMAMIAAHLAAGGLAIIATHLPLALEAQESLRILPGSTGDGWAHDPFDPEMNVESRMP